MRGRALGVLFTGLAWAQTPAPHLGYVYPAGGQRGTTFQVVVGGQALIGASKAFVSGAGMEAEVVEYARPLTGAEVQKMRDELAELVKTPAANAERIAELRKKVASAIRRPAQPAISETVTLKVTVAADAGAGERELRLLARGGLTNPLKLHVDALPEYTRAPIKVVTEFATGIPVKFREDPRDRRDAAPVDVALPAVLNGQVGPGMVNRYRFQAQRGQKLVAEVRARSLIPYISDAVPGWFQAALTLRDDAGKEVAAAGSHGFRPDPVLFCDIPASGAYTLEIRDAIHRGREDFVYRIALGELPYLTGVFPLGGKVAAPAAVELLGWNLPESRRTLRIRTAGVENVSAEKDGRQSNSLPFTAGVQGEVKEKEPNDLPKKAQKLKLPAVINGRIERKGGTDVFRFDAKAGQEVVAEVWARRLESPLDSVLRLTDSAGKEVAANDDAEDAGAGLLTHHADSRLQVKIARKGTYYLEVRDSQGRGGPDHGYRLRAGPPEPDFELRVTPASVTLGAGANTPITVYALRRDGFRGAIDLRLRNAPAGYVLSGARIPAGEEKVRLTINAPPGRAGAVFRLALEGEAQVGGRALVRPAVPAEDMMQAFAYHHLVPAGEWLAAVIGAGRAAMGWRVPAEKPLALVPGEVAGLRVSVPPRRQAAPAGRVEFALSDAPEGVSLAETRFTPGGIELLLKADAAKTKPGTAGNLIVDAFFVPAAAPSGQNRPRRQPIGVLPAIPFEIPPR